MCRVALHVEVKEKFLMDDGVRIRVRPATGEAEKIRGLGYMGLLAYGTHHQRHHWHLVRGQHPHSHGEE